MNKYAFWSWKDFWMFCCILFVLYMFVSCCANDIAEAYRKANNPVTVEIKGK